MTERPYDVLIVGELNADILLRGDVTPEFGQVEKIIDDATIFAGGSSGIFAAAAAKMGLRVLFASRVGNDLLGRFLVDSLVEAGVDISHIVVDERIKTGVTVLLSRGENRAILTYLGSIAEVGPEDIPDNAWQQTRHLHVASPFLLTRLGPEMPRMMRAAHAAAVTVSLDTNWDPSGRWDVDDLLAHVDVLLPNCQELKALARCDDLSGALKTMGDQVPVVAAKLGAEGAIGIEGRRAGGEVVSVPAMRLDVADTTGAGDTFDAGFLAAWLRGHSMRECLAVGAVCGALTTVSPGGFNGQPTWDEAWPLACALIEKAGIGSPDRRRAE